jgi:hypothetical protein
MSQDESGRIPQAPRSLALEPARERQVFEDLRQLFLPRILPVAPRPSVDWNRVRRIAYV